MDNNRVEKAIESKEARGIQGLKLNPVIYQYLMSGCAKNGDADGVFALYEKLKEKVWGRGHGRCGDGRLDERVFLEGNGGGGDELL